MIYLCAVVPPKERASKWVAFHTSDAWIALTNAVLVNSVLKYALQSFANRHVGATMLTAWACLVPVLP